MKIATVMGRLEPERSMPGLEEIRWIQARLEEGMTLAADLVGAEPGQTVLLAEGAAAQRLCMTCPADMIAVAVLK